MHSLILRAEDIVNTIRAVDKEFGICRALPPPLALDLLVLAEDRRFWRHPGFDLFAIFRACLNTLIGSRQGGSTIPQQLVRVITGRYQRTLARKLEEIIVSYFVCLGCERAMMLRVYLSLAYYGAEMQSFDSFVKVKGVLSNNDLAKAASLIARLKYPEPKRLSETRLGLIQRRERYILSCYRKLVEKGVRDEL